ncbi:MAG: TfoX/Sxy family protein [Alphaproteobacteria bacterium]
MYDAGLAERLREMIGGMPDMEESTMFGGFGYLMNGHICVFVWSDRLVIRIGVEAVASLDNDPYVGPMDFTGKAMRGWATVSAEGIAEDDDLQRYVEMAIMFCASLPAKGPKKSN